MTKDKKRFLQDLNNYGVLYYLVGMVEVTLRERMIITLRNLALKRNRGEWFSVLPEEKQFNDFLARAILQNNGKIDGLEIFLPFLFWRNLFANRHYTTLWIPTGHQVFLGLRNQASHESFLMVQEKIVIIHKIRNRVAHYDFEGSAEFAYEREILLWFIQALGK